ncbi:ATP-binding protein [Ktedonobacteria bacterium brp13]|nr:ATP-binding protein [Ktedonobacteria bacterium brp13]
MYFNAKQIERSLQHLDELHPFFGTIFLALQEANLPEGHAIPISFIAILGAFLEKYYRPTSKYGGFYTPFKTSNKHQRWNTYQYANSLRRVAVDTFSDVTLHPNSRDWGWKKGYIDILHQEHLSETVPTLHLAIWLFRNRNWSGETTPENIIQTFFEEFHIGAEEQKLFNPTLTGNNRFPFGESLWQEQPISEETLLAIIGVPPNVQLKPKRRQPTLFDNTGLEEYGAKLQHLTMTEIGPADEFELDCATRINAITGDNALGKTFLLECAWWALTNTWASKYPAHPKKTAQKPAIAFQIGKEGQPGKTQTVPYDWKSQSWSTTKKRNILPGLSVFAQADGSFAVWDPAKIDSLAQYTDDTEAFLNISREDVWDGVIETIKDKKVVRCRGLIEDWITWQTSKSAAFDDFRAALKALSPHPQDILKPGEPTRIPELDVRLVPTIEFSYGSVPVMLCSAGIKRIVALAYILVWAWHEHVEQAQLTRTDPQRSIVLIIDEMEAHLHPFWQRAIVPAIIAVIHALSKETSTQIIIATHSPLVLASMEPVFDEDQDKLFHLRVDEDDRSVQLEEMPFVKRGRIDRWLTSDIFGLAQPRSQEAEVAIQEANAIQLEDNPAKEQVQTISDTLVRLLAQDDEYWPLWTYFAKERGVIL